MAKRGGKPGRSRWVISKWVDWDGDEFWITAIAVVGWVVAIVVLMKWG